MGRAGGLCGKIAYMPYWFDGNNLIGQSARRAQTDPEARNGFLALLSGYCRARGGRFTVFFDGDDPGGRVPPRGVQVCYSAPTSADDAILRRLEGTITQSEVIVVTNDLSLRARCRDAGAQVMNWEDFLSRMRIRSRAGRPDQGKGDAIDLDDWIRYFGWEKQRLR